MQDFIRETIHVDENSKLIIALGDSFVEGQGAVSKETWEKYNWSEEDMTNAPQEHPEFKELRWEEHNNSFVNVLCRDYFPEFTPINFGYRGNGNRAATKALSLHPDLNLSVAKEKIVILFVGQFVRFDFFNNLCNDGHSLFHTIWPHETTSDQRLGVRNLWNGYATEVFNDKTGALELICNIIEVQNWCKVNNAKLIIANSFEYSFDKEFLNDALSSTKYLQQMVDEIEWDKVYKPDGYDAFIDILTDMEGQPELKERQHQFYYWAKENAVNDYTPGGFLTPCAHPSPKGHKVYAELFAKKIRTLL